MEGDRLRENRRRQFDDAIRQSREKRRQLQDEYNRKKAQLQEELDENAAKRVNEKSAEYVRTDLMVNCQAFGDRMIGGLVDIQTANNEKNCRREYNLIVQRNKENANKLEDAVRDLGRFVNNIEGKKLDEEMEANIKMKLANIKKILSPGFGQNLDHDVNLMLQRSFSVNKDVAELRQENLKVRKKNF
ncbi:hypothetical protein WR25_15676 isoform B [Diploscapter pachys]|uniref:Uncharacterized protein n=1 Tax=Diploscapter pachys TaxID=2018661 RepID=A0A2A2J3S2_9BILA|nr:hypothetical protein WR25_15676 isoform B [Diploscapter pachys]